jgi:hypothetical protein
MTTAAAEHGCISVLSRPFTISASARALLVDALVLSGVETVLAFVIILGVLLRPLVLAPKPA